MSSLNRLVREIESQPKLSPAEERDLAALAREGDGEARKRLIASTMRHALPIALALAKDGSSRWEPGDLIGEAVRVMDGLIERYDGTGTFSGYAKTRMRGTMKDFLRRRADLLRTNGHGAEVLSMDAGDEDGDRSLHDVLDSMPSGDAEDVGREVPALKSREERVLRATILREPTPGTIEDASRELGLKPATVRRVLARALRLRPAC